MRTVTTEPNPPAEPNTRHDLLTFSGALSDGRQITVREMTGRDLLYIEDELSALGETRQSFHLVERLNVGPEKVSFDEVADMGARDLKVVVGLIKQANGSDEGKKDPK